MTNRLDHWNGGNVKSDLAPSPLNNKETRPHTQKETHKTEDTLKTMTEIRMIATKTEIRMIAKKTINPRENKQQ